MKLAAFDLEIAKILPEGETDWHAHRPLGISCAAIQLSHEDPRGQILVHQGAPQMMRDECQVLVAELFSLVEDGYTIVTWNGLSFDFDVLAEESAMHAACAELALGHVDMMCTVVALRGHYLALDTAAKGMGVAGKLKEARLSTGEIISDMSGAKAPELWSQGEHELVLQYLQEDVRVTLELAQAIAQKRRLAWISRSGRTNIIPFGLYPVRAALSLPRPDTSWMANPPSLAAMSAWTLREKKDE